MHFVSTTQVNVKEWCKSAYPSREEEADVKRVETVLCNYIRYITFACDSYRTYPEKVVLGGSTAKNTCVKGRFDLDVVVFISKFDPKQMEAYKSEAKERLNMHIGSQVTWLDSTPVALCFVYKGFCFLYLTRDSSSTSTIDTLLVFTSRLECGPVVHWRQSSSSYNCNRLQQPKHALLHGVLR